MWSHVFFGTQCIYDLLLVELFDVEYCRDLEIWIKGHSRSLKLVPLGSLGTVSYSRSILTIALSCIVCEIWRLISRKSRNFYTPSAFSARGDPVGISRRCLILVKLK